MDKHDSHKNCDYKRQIHSWRSSDNYKPRSIASDTKFSEEIRRLQKRVLEKDREIDDREITINYLERENDDLRRKIDKLKEKLRRKESERKSSNIVWLEEDSEEDQLLLELHSNSSNNIDESSSSEEERNPRGFLQDDNINPDEMTYEELLELGEKIGVVCKGFSEEQIKMIPIVKYKKSNSEIKDEMCSVCQYDFLPGERLRMMTCRHTFHRRCVDDWLKKEKVCPNCKEEVLLDGE